MSREEQMAEMQRQAALRREHLSRVSVFSPFLYSNHITSVNDKYLKFMNITN